MACATSFSAALVMCDDLPAPDARREQLFRPASLIAPLLTLSPAITLGIGAVILGEQPSRLGTLEVLTIVGGAYALPFAPGQAGTRRSASCGASAAHAWRCWQPASGG